MVIWKASPPSFRCIKQTYSWRTSCLALILKPSIKRAPYFCINKYNIGNCTTLITFFISYFTLLQLTMIGQLFRLLFMIKNKVETSQINTTPSGLINDNIFLIDILHESRIF